MTCLRIETNDMLTLEGNEIQASISNQEYAFPLESVEKIVILTTDMGPFYDDMGLAIDVGSDTVIFIMSEHRCFQTFLFEQVGKALPVDYQKIIEASTCIEKGVFEIYRKSDN